MTDIEQLQQRMDLITAKSHAQLNELFQRTDMLVKVDNQAAETITMATQLIGSMGEQLSTLQEHVLTLMADKAEREKGGEK